MIRGAARLACALAALGLVPALAGAEQGKLLATGGATALEGSAGGGLVPWAVLSGYGTEDQLGGALALTRVRVDDYVLDAYAGSFTIHDRVELSFAHHRFDAEPFNTIIRQNMVGAKVRLTGDLIYTRMPQLAAGFTYKKNLDFGLPKAVNARHSSGVDYYVSGSKLFLGGVFGYNVLLSGTLRATKANQMGLLGFGGDRRSGYSLVPEGSLAVLLNRRAVIGYEYRAKPNNLRFAKEEAFQDVFGAYFLNKRLALVGAYTRLGSVAGSETQNGYYVSLQGSF